MTSGNLYEPRVPALRGGWLARERAITLPALAVTGFVGAALVASSVTLQGRKPQ